MGRQIAPGDTLFAGAAVSSAGSGVDLNLEGGQGRVDIELLAPPASDSIDLDLGDALGGSDATAETGEHEVIDLGFEGKAAGREAPTVEMPTIEVRRTESPTVQTAALGAHTGDTMSVPVGAAAAESTAEVSMDELGIDVKEPRGAGGRHDDRPRFHDRGARGDRGTGARPVSRSPRTSTTISARSST